MKQRIGLLKWAEDHNQDYREFLEKAGEGHLAIMVNWKLNGHRYFINQISEEQKKVWRELEGYEVKEGLNGYLEIDRIKNGGKRWLRIPNELCKKIASQEIDNQVACLPLADDPLKDVVFTKLQRISPKKLHIYTDEAEALFKESEKKLHSKVCVSKGVRCILWKHDPEKLELLSDLLAEQEYIKNTYIWLDHFRTGPLSKTEADPVNWKGNTYEIQHLLRKLKGLDYLELLPNLESHFIVRGKRLNNLGGGQLAYNKLDRIKAILEQM